MYKNNQKYSSSVSNFYLFIYPSKSDFPLFKILITYVHPYLHNPTTHLSYMIYFLKVILCYG